MLGLYARDAVYSKGALLASQVAEDDEVILAQSDGSLPNSVYLCYLVPGCVK
jgi:hypothetical protein